VNEMAKNNIIKMVAISVVLLFLISGFSVMVYGASGSGYNGFRSYKNTLNDIISSITDSAGWLSYNWGPDMNNTNSYSSSTTYSGSTTVPFNITWQANTSYSPITADLYKNGYLDLIVETSPSTISIYNANGMVIHTLNPPNNTGLSGGTITYYEVDYMNSQPMIVVGVLDANGNNPTVVIYNGNGSIAKILSTGLPDTIQPHLVDLQGDGNYDVVVNFYDSYTGPRGIAVYSYSTGQHLWTYYTGPYISDISFGDLLGNGQMDIVLSTFAPCNGQTGNGTNDWTAYVIVLSPSGSVIWMHAMGQGQVHTRAAIVKLPGSSLPDVFFLVHSSDLVDPDGSNNITIFNGVTGATMYTYSGPNGDPWNSYTIVNNLNGSLSRVYVVGYNSGTIYEFSPTLNLIKTVVLQAPSTEQEQTLVAANLVKNGGTELVYRTELSNGTNEVYVLNATTLSTLWVKFLPNMSNGPTIVSAIGNNGVNSILLTGNKMTILSPLSSFPKYIYKITFFESGLSLGTLWSVTLNGSTETSTTNAITFTEPNGTYTFSVGVISGYTAIPSSGTLTINGNNVEVNILFNNNSMGITLGNNVLDASGNTFFVNYSSNTLFYVNSTVGGPINQIKVGQGPVAIASFTSISDVPGLQYLKNILCVVNQLSDNITIINSSSLSIIGSIKVGKMPVSIALGYGLIAVSNYGSENITIINVVNIQNGINWVKEFSIPLSGSPTGLVFNPYTNDLFVSLSNKHEIEEISVNVNSNSYSLIGYLNSMASPMGIAMDQNGWLYVANSGSSTISVYIPNGNVYPDYPNLNISVGQNPINVILINGAQAQGYQVSALVIYKDSSNISFIPIALIENPDPVLNITFQNPVIGLADYNNSAFVCIINSGQIIYRDTYLIGFNFYGGAVSYSLNNILIGAPVYSLPGAVMLPSGNYNFGYILQAGYENPILTTSGNVYVSSGIITISGKGSVTVSSTQIPNWVNSGDFTVLPFNINFGQIGPFVINQKLVSYPLSIYVLLPSSGENLNTFYSDLNYYFNITVPQNYQPCITIILHLPIIGIINSVFGTNYPQQTYKLPLGNYLSFLTIQNITTSSTGSLNLAVTISSSLTVHELLKDILKTIWDDFKSFLKGNNITMDTLLENLNDILKTIEDSFDLTITDINSSLQSTGKLNGYTIADIVNIQKAIQNIENNIMAIPNAIENVKNTVEKLIDDVYKVMATPDEFEAWMDVAAVTPPPFDIIPTGLAINSVIDGGLHLSDLVLTLANIIWPSLSQNTYYEDFKNAINIGIEIEDPNGTTALPSIYVNNTLALGYDSISGNVIDSSEYGTFYQVGNDYYAYVNFKYSPYVKIEMNGVGGNGSAPYKLMISTVRNFTTFTGMVESNSSLVIPIVINSTGSIKTSVYLSPKLVLRETNHGYNVTVLNELSNGNYVNISYAVLFVGNNEYTMQRINNTAFGYLIPFNMLTSNIIQVYSVSKNYSGGYASIILPMYKITLNESGLPSGTLWFVNLSNGQSFNSTDNMISFYEPNGTYTYIVSSINKSYAPKPSSGTITVNGANVTQEITFSSSSKLPPKSSTNSNDLLWIGIILMIVIIAIISGIFIRKGKSKKPPKN
jgi:hypothetical protein